MKARFADSPHDRLTEIGNIGMQAILEAIQGEKLWIQVMLTDENGDGGIVLHGYEKPLDAFEDIVQHINAIAQVEGKKLVMIPMPKPIGSDS